MSGLGARLQPCGPVIDAAAAGRARETLEAAVEGVGAWSVVEPVFAASPYLTGLARRSPDRLRRVLEQDPDLHLNAILLQMLAAAADGALSDEVKARMRRLKGDLHLLTALADLGGVWDLDAVTGALSRAADAALTGALQAVAHAERQRGRLVHEGSADRGPIPGLFVIALGKHGAFELNYSSDIDVSVFFEPEILRDALAPGTEVQGFANRCAQGVANVLSDRTADGYVFRVDLRLRPDPSSTPPAVAAPYALNYYESVGQNWERAAFIKARAAAGDRIEANDFLKALVPFVWRRNLDYAAIADIHSIKRQIHVHKADERLDAAGANLKLGRGGIREVEFFVQTQQLILGGRDPSLRSCRTLDALKALEAAGHVEAAAAEDLARGYVRLRSLEHRIQMLDDEQTHILPAEPERRERVMALSGERELETFDRDVETTLRTVNRRYGGLFAESEDLSSAFGSLVFTGVEDDPETLETLKRMGFADPARVSSTIRAWHHGRVNATRTARGRELFTRLAPRLLEALQATGAPDAAFNRFTTFFQGLSAGVQVQSLFLAEPELFQLIVRVMGNAPRLAATLARRPAALDAVMDRNFFEPLARDTGVTARIVDDARRASGFEAAMDAVRRQHREQAFRIGLQVLSGTATAEEAGQAYADLADACLEALAPAALDETVRQGGDFPGEAAILALGKFGSREMTATSDLDVMTIYRCEDPKAVSATKGWMAETVYGRFTQRLIAALSAHTAEGGLYEIDMQLRPTGSKGPVAVSLSGFESYYERDADTWEFLALTRARVAFATSPAFAETVTEAVEQALRRPRDPDRTVSDVRSMRTLMERERPAKGFWDMKLAAGAQVDAEFAAQFLQILNGPRGGPLRSGTLMALEACERARLARPEDLRALAASWSLHQSVSQFLKSALTDENADPEGEPAAFQALLARAVGAAGLDELRDQIVARREAARAAFERVVSPRSL
jgi:glutamate-ammonia-ligase adenylyltransferase